MKEEVRGKKEEIKGKKGKEREKREEIFVISCLKQSC